MGNTESNERQLFIGVILQLLSKRGIKVKKSTIQSFFSFVQEHCPWFLQQGIVNLGKSRETAKSLLCSSWLGENPYLHLSSMEHD